jgi:kynurenine formamidase
MSKWIYLSYPLSAETPAYGGGDSLRVSSGKSIQAGNSCNTSIWKLSNHLGTHIDFPKHVAKDGKAGDDYPPEFWIFNHPKLVDLSPVQPGHIIGPVDIERASLGTDVDLLLIKTGFCYLRPEPLYWQENPGLDPSVADFLRESFPSLKVIGFDFISLSSFMHRELGRKAHSAFLDHACPLLLLEDVNLSFVDVETRLKDVIISPLVVAQSDAAPCTVFAEIVE